MKYLQLERFSNYTIVTIDRPKVNAIEAELVAELRSCFHQLAEDNDVQGVILTGTQHIFSAGLDLVELLHYDEAKMTAFFRDFSALHYELVAFPKPLICAVNGHCPAGGTVIALAADFRVMASGEKYKIGLNEVSVNIQISEMLIESYAFWLGQRQSYQNIITGKLLSPTEALHQGLVDRVVSLENVLATAEDMMKNWLQANPVVLRNTKKKLRQAWIEKLNQCNHNQDLRQASEVWWNPEVRSKIEAYVQLLKSK